LEVHSGQVRAEPIRRNDSATFIRFLRRLLNAYPAQELYIIADNGSSHRSKKTLAWVAKHQRLHLTFTPTHASWLNQIEIWFGILTRKVVRRGIFKSREERVERLMNIIHAYNQEARPLQWTCHLRTLSVPLWRILRRNCGPVWPVRQRTRML
jgi:transposase